MNTEGLLKELEAVKKEVRRLEDENSSLKTIISNIEENYALHRNTYEAIKKQKKHQDIYLSLIFEHIPDIILIIDNYYQLLNATHESIKKYGVSLESIYDKSVIEICALFCSKEQTESFAGHITEVMETGIAKEFPEHELVISGNPYIFNVNIVPLKESDEVIGVMLNLNNVSDLHNAVVAAEHDSKAKSSFLAKFSHEIRTPMNAILGLSELALREEINNEVRERLNGIKDAGNNLILIVNDILDFSKIESGMMEIVPTPFTVDSLIDYAIGIIRMRVVDLPILFTVYIDPSIPEHLFGDEVRLKQMILNLLSNACKYSEKGFVKLRVEHIIIDDETIMLCVEVEDSGIGIKSEDMGALFGDFVQLGEAVGKKKVEGTGLGLAITRGFARTMGGEITVESEYGVGSVFTLIVPQKIDTTKKGEVFACIDDNDNCKVLIYETREVYAESLVETFVFLGIKHRLTTTQSEFIIEIARKKYDYLFVPSFAYDGVRKALRELGNNNDSSIILITKYGGADVEIDNAKTLYMPAHSSDIADIFNNKPKSKRHKGQKDVHFIAPTARVLIVDDINTNLIVAQGLMSPYKMTVDLCKSGLDAIELVKKHDYDIVFMDHMMPEMDGIEATAKIRALTPSNGRSDNYYKNLPFVALTANAVSGMKEMFIKNGFNDFLAKPIDIGLLSNIIEKWLPADKIDKYTVSEENKGSAPPSFRIEGIDVESGIYMTGGNAENYLKTLSIFRKDGVEKVDELRHCVMRGDMPLYATLAHALKSACASIGASKISSFARTLETSAKSGDKEFVEKNNERFIDELTMLLESIKYAVSSANTAKKTANIKVDAIFTSENAKKLQVAINDLDMEAVDNLLSALRSKADDSIEKIIDEISNNILICEYDTAAELAGELISV